MLERAGANVTYQRSDPVKARTQPTTLVRYLSDKKYSSAAHCPCIKSEPHLGILNRTKRSLEFKSGPRLARIDIGCFMDSSLETRIRLFGTNGFGNLEHGRE